MTYKIIRMRFKGSPRTIKTGLTLEQAQAHCRDPKTHGEGWFDGYTEEPAKERVHQSEAEDFLRAFIRWI